MTGIPPEPGSAQVGRWIEDLYQLPLADLRARCNLGEGGQMLAALIGLHTRLELAERNVAYQLTRVQQLAAASGEITVQGAGHIVDCANRLALAIAARDVHHQAATAVLHGLRRAPAAPAVPAAVPAVPESRSAQAR